MQDLTPTEPAPTRPAGAAPVSAARRYLPLALLVAAMAIVLANGWHKQLTLANIADQRDRFQLILAEHRALSLLSYVAVYAVAVALSLPGALILTLTGGLLFGTLAGGSAAVIGASIGATAIFLIARTAFGEVLAKKAGPALLKLQDGFKENALSYLLFLRLVPAFPFFLVNLAPALLGVPLRTYLIGTFFGIIPATFAFASVGAGLDSVIAAARAANDACVAAKGAGACTLAIDARSLVTKELLLSFALLGCVALIPVAYKTWRSKNGDVH